MPNYRLAEGSIQYDFYNCRSPIQIFGGGYGNGKTTALVIKSLQLAKDYPGSNGLLARETYPKLNDTLRKVFFEWCPPHWIKRKPTQDDNTCYLHNGSVINFRYIAQRGKQNVDGSTTSNLLSATYDWIGVDQVEDPGITHKDLLDLMGRLRGKTAYRPTDKEDPSMPTTGPRWLMLTANPSPNWFYKEIVQPYILWQRSGIKNDKLLIDAETGVPIINLFEGSTYTNRANLPADFIRNLEAMYKGQQKERFLLGKWAAYEGLVYSHYSSDRNVLSRDEMMAHLVKCRQRHVQVRAIESYDFGLTSPSCYLLAFVDDYGRVFVLDGFYKPNYHYNDQAAEIHRIRARYIAHLSFDRPVQADPAIFKRVVVAGSKDTGDTIAKLFRENEVYMHPASNDILAGIAKVSAYIAGTLDTPHPITGAMSSPLFYVADDIQFFDDEINSYYWQRNPLGKQIDDPMDDNDHAMDATKYLLAHLPDPAKIKPPKAALPPRWSFWHEVEDNQLIR